MTTARVIHASTTPYVSSSNSDLPANREGPPLSDETSPLLKPKHTHADQSSTFKTWNSALSSFFDANAGLLLVTASQIFFSAMNLSVKVLNSLDEPVPTFELILVRMGITTVFSVTYMYWKKIPDPFLGPKGVRTLLVFRGFCGFTGLCGMYFSLQYLSLSDATVLTFLTPTFIGFSGALFLKEPLSPRALLAGLFSFVGVIFIARPQFLFGNPQGLLDPSKITPTQRMISVIAALFGVVGTTGAYTLVRGIGKRVHVLHAITSFTLQCVLGSTLGMILFKLPFVIPTRTYWLVMLVLIGIFGFLAQVLITMGLQREAAGRSALAIYTSIVFAVAFEFAVFHTTPSTLSIIGALMVVSSAIYTSLTKQKATAKPASDTSSERMAGDSLASGRDDDPGA